MTASTARPAPEAVGQRAAEILSAVEADEAFERLVASTAAYPQCWATFTGYPIIAQFDLDADAWPLIDEALRVLALKSAVYELSDHDEQVAELVVSPPVDEMVHAVLAQYTLCVQIQTRLGIHFVHMTDQERFGWTPGDYTDQCYQAAGWGVQNPRYWVPAAEVSRRMVVLDEAYEMIGVENGGRVTSFDFELEKAVA